MKTTTLATLLVSLCLAACGGGGSGGSSPAPTPAPITPAPATPAPVTPAPTTPAPTTPADPVASLYPSYNTSPLPPNATGMSSTAAQIASKIKVGWNAGNTLEAIGGETYWGNPLITPELMQVVKSSGFTAVRLPTSWDQYADQKTGKISDVWLNRVKQVVQYCVDNGLYVVVNIHWDGGWLDENINAGKQAAVKAKQKAYWEQIATQLRDFDEHLIFAGANEPPVKDAAQMDILMSYHQTFVDTVRATGGRNAHRILVVQGPNTDIEVTNKLMKTMPTDTVANRLMAEVHYYGPSQFGLLTEDASWGKMFYYWGNGYHSTTDTGRNASWGEEAYVDSVFALMKQQFVDKGIPVILGEYGAIRRTTLTGDNLALHLDSRAYYLNHVTKKAIAYGLTPFYWDEGSNGNNGFGIIKRSNNTVFDQKALDAIMNGAKGL